MADKYINATKALNNVKKFQTEGDDFALLIKELAENLFNKLPAADVVEVVRCKDCKHSKYKPIVGRLEEREQTALLYCTMFVNSQHIYEDDFCSYGERKE